MLMVLATQFLKYCFFEVKLIFASININIESRSSVYLLKTN